MERRTIERRATDRRKEKPFHLEIPNETKMRFLKLRADIVAVMDRCYICGAFRPWGEIHNCYNKGACNSCMCHEFNHGE